MYDPVEMRQAIEALPSHRRQNLRQISNAIGVPLATLHRYNREPDETIILPHSSPLYPYLTEEHRSARVFYALSKLDLTTGRYDGCYQRVDVDEKWFFLTLMQLKMYLTQREIDDGKKPVRRVVHKIHIVKVMFLAATARPRFNNGVCTFDGKIGI